MGFDVHYRAVMGAAALALWCLSARGEDAPTGGAALAAAIEAGAVDAAAAAAAVDRLSVGQRDLFVSWATARRRAGEPWRRLGPSLARLGTRRAAAELGAVACSRAEAARSAVHGLGAMPFALSVRELLAALRGEARSARALARRTLVARISGTAGALPLLEHALGDPTLNAPAGEVAGAVAEAAAAAPDAQPFLVAHLLQSPTAAGVAQGLAARAERERQELSAHEAAERRARYADRLAELARAFAAPAGEGDGDAPVHAAVFRALPALCDELPIEWREPLLSGLEHEGRGVRDAAWAALRALTGASLPQARGAWERWLAREDAEGDS